MKLLRKVAFFHNLPDGGGKRILLGLIAEFCKRGVCVDEYSYPKEKSIPLAQPEPPKAKYKHFPINWLKMPQTIDYLKLILGGGYEKKCRQLAKKIDKKKYSCIFLGGDRITQTPILPKYLKTKNICLAHEPKREFYEKTECEVTKLIKQYFWKILVKKLKKLEKESLSSTNLIITNSLFSKNVFKRFLGPKIKIEIISPFVAEYFLKEESIISKKRCLYLSVGRFSYLKGFDFIIRSFALLPIEKRPELCLAGQDGSHKKRLTRLANKLKVKVRFFQEINDKELKKIYHETKVFLYFPIREPFGLSIIEAAISGCRTIAINEGGFSETMFNDQKCTLIPRKSKLLAHLIMKGLTEKREVNNKNFISLIKKGFTVKNYVDTLIDLTNA